MPVKKINIINRSYYFYNDLINLSNFETGNLNLDQRNLERH